jgi:hypothetical protein
MGLKFNPTTGNLDIDTSGSGVSGPASSTDSNFVQFDGTNGDTLKDSNLSLTTTLANPGVDTKIPSEKAVRTAIGTAGGGDVTGPASSTDNNIAIFNGITGKIIQDGGNTIAQVKDRANHTGTQVASTISDFDTEVSNNVDVSANTIAKHDAVTVTDSGEIDFTLSGQDITASIKVGSVDETKLDTSINASLDLADSALQNITGEVIGSLSNVVITTPANNEVLAYDTISTNFINQTPTEAGFATVSITGDHTDLSNIGTNTHAQIDTHISSTGADHTYINQDVTSNSSPTFDGANFTGISAGALSDTYLKTSGASIITVSATEPSTPSSGDLWVDSS